MKRTVCKLISLCFVLTMMLSATITAFATEDVLTINGEAKANVGDTVKYSLYLSDCTEEIIGFELRLFYDSDCLEMNKDSIKYEKFDGVIHNTNIPGKFPTSWTNISQPADFSSKALFLSAEFKVLKAGDAEISYFVTDMYGDDMTYLKSYKWTYDISVNNEAVLSEKTPPVRSDEDIKQGSFINYVDGMGEENSPNKSNHEVVKSTVKSTEIVTHYKELTQNNPSGNTNGSMTYIIIGVAIAIIVLAIVAIMIVKKRDESVENTDATEKTD